METSTRNIDCHLKVIWKENFKKPWPPLQDLIHQKVSLASFPGASNERQDLHGNSLFYVHNPK